VALATANLAKEQPMANAANGDKVQIHYTGKLEDGRVFDSSDGREPLEFTIGEREVIEGVDSAVKGMAAGEKKTVTLPPELAYGPVQEQLRFKVPAKQLPEGAEPGIVLGLTVGEQTMQAVLVAIEGDDALLDGNPPLAGMTLVFEIELLTINGEGKSLIQLP
jgi:peptidylprolyl isomerase